MFERGQEVFIHRMRFLVAGRPRPGLIFESHPLVIGIVQLRERVGDLFSRDEELKAIGQPRIGRAAARQRRYLHRVPEHKGRLDQLRLDQLVEEFGDQSAPSKPGLGFDVVFLDQRLQLRNVGTQEVVVHLLADRLHHLDSLERSGEMDLVALVLDGRRPLDALRQVNDERLGDLHHPLDVGVRLV